MIRPPQTIAETSLGSSLLARMRVSICPRVMRAFGGVSNPSRPAHREEATAYHLEVATAIAEGTILGENESGHLRLLIHYAGDWHLLTGSLNGLVLTIVSTGEDNAAQQ